MTEEIKEKLVEALENYSQVTLKQLKEKLGLPISETTISLTLNEP